ISNGIPPARSGITPFIPELHGVVFKRVLMMPCGESLCLTIRHDKAENARLARQQTGEAIRALQERITTVSMEEADLRGQLDQYSLRGKRRSVLTIVARVAQVSVLLTAVFLLLAFVLATHLVKP
ncbi:MAG: hypothetical protein ACYDBJ_21585, partial [Aggregatilineales bacterium]